MCEEFPPWLVKKKKNSCSCFPGFTLYAASTPKRRTSKLQYGKTKAAFSCEAQHCSLTLSSVITSGSDSDVDRLRLWRISLSAQQTDAVQCDSLMWFLPQIFVNTQKTKVPGCTSRLFVPSINPVDTFVNKRIHFDDFLFVRWFCLDLRSSN